MLILPILFNLLLVLAQTRRRFRGGGGRAAGIGKMTETFGKGVATLIKDIKQGNWDDEQFPQYNQKKSNRFADGGRYAQQMGTSPTFYIAVIVTALVVVIAGIYISAKLKQSEEQQEGLTAVEMKKRNNQRYKHYDAVKMIAQSGIHPDKAFGRLQKISYREKKKQ